MNSHTATEGNSVKEPEQNLPAPQERLIIPQGMPPLKVEDEPEAG